MKYTGERLIPGEDEKEIEAEHFHRYRVIAKQLKDKYVLDAGCGAGYGSNLLAQYCSEVVGMDISSETIGWCKEHYGQQKNLRFVESSLVKLPFKDSTFDCIVNLEVIEHVEKDIQEAFLKEARRVLKPKGILICSTPNKEIYTDKSGYKNPYHVCEFYSDEFREFLNKEFSYVRMYNQELYMVSSILEDGCLEGAQVIKNNGIEEVEKYMIAVCSNSKRVASKIDINSFYKYDDSACSRFATVYPESQENQGQFSSENKIGTELFTNDANEFLLEFDISGFNSSKKLRFDPVENHFCLCRIDEVMIDGKSQEIMPLNALEYYKEGFVFLNTDPQFEIKCDFENANKLTIKGYFKLLSEVEVSGFIDKLYSRLPK